MGSDGRGGDESERRDEKAGKPYPFDFYQPPKNRHVDALCNAVSIVLKGWWIMGLKIRKTKEKGEAKTPRAKKVKEAPVVTTPDPLQPGVAAVDVDDVTFSGEGKKYFHVIKGAHSAIVTANSKDEAKGAFFALFGIVSTEERVRVGEVDEDDLPTFQLNEFGVILGTA